MWTRHASRETLLALALEGRGGAGNAHVERCDRCAREVAALRAVVLDLRDDAVPEPSPLFWEHLPARVQAALAEGAPGDAGAGRFDRLMGAARRWAFVAAPVLAVTLVVIGLRWTRVPQISQPADRAAVSAPAASAGEAVVAPEWRALQEMAELLSADDLIGTGVASAPGTAERAVAALSSKEQQTLAQLLADEIDGPR